MGKHHHIMRGMVLVVSTVMDLFYLFIYFLGGVSKVFLKVD